ncbi:MAG: TerC family protein, partial [Ignavibacteria bacterium]|nr:TerC family protein [Ignavibacteria bacterium]
PKGYVYFAMAFSFLVEMLNIKMRNKRNIEKKQQKISN